MDEAGRNQTTEILTITTYYNKLCDVLVTTALNVKVKPYTLHILLPFQVKMLTRGVRKRKMQLSATSTQQDSKR